MRSHRTWAGWLNRSFVAYVLFAVALGLLIDQKRAQLKILNYLRNDGRYLNDISHGLGTYEEIPFDKGVEYYERLLRLKPHLTMTHGVLGFAYAHQAHWSRAADAYGQAAAEHPDLFGFHYNLGVLRYKQKQYDRARQAFRHAMDIGPQKSVAHYVIVGKRRFAEHPSYQKAWVGKKTQALRTAYQRLFEYWVATHLAEDQYDQAAAVAQAALRSDPENPALFQFYARHPLGLPETVPKAWRIPAPEALTFEDMALVTYTPLFETGIIPLTQL